MRRASVFALVCSALFLTAPTGVGQAPQPSFDPVGLQGKRGYFAQLPFENVDMVNGNLILTFTDLILPGNAGMDLRIVRTYNHQAPLKWSFGFMGAPLWIEDPEHLSVDELWRPTAVTADGNRHRLWGFSSDEYLFTSDFWRYHRASRTLEFPNGWVATYETTPGLGIAMLVEVHDPFGNALEPDWEGGLATDIRPLRLDGVTQKSYGIGASWSRTVTFVYPSTHFSRLPETMSFNGRTWTYTEDICCVPGTDQRLLRSVDPPGDTGGIWSYAYEFNGTEMKSGSVTVTTPAGGTVVYGFSAQILPSYSGPSHRSVIQSVTTGGRDVLSAQWTFSFNQATNAVGTASGPQGRSIVFEQEPGHAGTYWLLRKKTLYDGETAALTFERDYEQQPMPPRIVSWAAPKEERIIQDGKTYKTTFGYRSTDFADYHKPSTITETGDLERVTTREYDSSESPYIVGRQKSVTVEVAGKSFLTTFDYEDTGFLKEQIVNGVKTTFVRDHFGNRQKTTDANGHETLQSYDFGVLDDTTTPEYTIARSINSDGTVASETRGDVTTAFDYDDVGRVIGVNRTGADPTITRYEPDGSFVAVHRGSPSTESRTFFDGYGRPTKTRTAAGVETVTTYDVFGQKAFESYPYDDDEGSSTSGDAFTYDALGRLRFVTHPPPSLGVQSFVQYAYGAGPTAGHVTITDEEARVTVQKWRAFGDPSDARLASVVEPHPIDPAGREWFYSYNTLGSLTSVDGPGEADRSWIYDDVQGWLRRETHPESGTTTYTYDNVGNVKSKTDAEGRVVVYEYDGNYRLKKILTPDGVDDVTIGYDNFDNRTTLVNGAASTTFTYLHNRLRKRDETIAGRTFSTLFDYDGRDNLRVMTYPSQRKVIYDVDDADRVYSVRGEVGSISREFATNIAYHPSGAIKSYLYKNAAGSAIATETVTFDERQRPKRLTDQLSDQSYALHLTYTYDRVGNVKQIEDPRPDRGWTYTYDVLHRLATATGPGSVTYGYDDAGNRLTRNAGAPSATNYTIESHTQRLVGVSGPGGSGTYGYDAVGNLKSDPASDQTFTYNTFNMMRTAQLGATVPRNVYGYDGDNLRVTKSSDDGVFYYVHGAGSQVLAEYDASSGEPDLLREYVYLGSKLLASIGRGAVPEPPLGVRITSPGSGDSFPNDEPTTIAADVTSSPPGDPVSKVEFYRDGLLIGTDTTAPYALDWVPNLPAGTYGVMARVVTASTLSAVSAPVSVRVFLVGRVTGVTVTPASLVVGQTATITVTGNMNICGAVELDFGDGERWVDTHGLALSASPFVRPHVWTTGGPKVVTAKGHGDCRGTVSTTFTPIGPLAAITSPASGANFLPPATIPITGSASDSSGQAIARVDFYNGSTLIGSDSTSPYEMTWSGVGIGSYVLTAHAVNAANVEGISAPVHVSVSSLGSATAIPASVVVGQPVTIHVTGVNPCGALTFNYGDGPPFTQAIGGLPADSDPPHAWSTPGNKVVTVSGNGTCNGVISVTVPVAANSAPTVALTAPADGAMVRVGSTIAMMATASDSDGLAAVQFYADGVLRGTDNTAPYSVDWVGVPYGSHTLMARAIDVFGIAGVSTTVSVTARYIESVSFWPAMPIAGRQMGVAVHGSSACSAVQVNYGDGQIVTYNTPLEFANWHTYVNPGTYTVTATGQGTCAGTASTTITVAAPPSVAITWPPEGQTYAAPADVAMTASASDPDGTIQGVTWYFDGYPLVWTATPPYFAILPGVGVGRFALSAVALDSQGLRTVSAPLTITVGSPAPSLVSGVTVLPQNPLEVGELARVTISGTNPCTAVQVNFGNGDVQTLPIASLPHTIEYAWYAAGPYTVTAIGVGGCGGSFSRSFTVGAAPPAPAPDPTNDPIVDDPHELESDSDDAHDAVTVVETREPEAVVEAATPVPQTTVSLIVNLMGTGSGTVVTSPAAITCAGGFGLRCVADLTPGTVVTLATATDAGSAFTGWGGACSGTAACQITVSQQTMVVATFRVPPPQVTQYYHLDMLGTVRAVTGENGALMRQMDYGPFGEDLALVEPQAVPPIAKQQRFTGKERDVETSLDYFGSRYYRPTLGRFMSIDRMLVSSSAIKAPQRWNRYAYVSNRPTNRLDYQGAYEIDVHKHLTRVLGIAAGIDVATATAIAAADQAVDDNWQTGPFWLPGARRDFHFTTAEQRDVLWNRFLVSGSAEELGRFFHAAQDSYSHAGFQPEPGHVHTTWYDKTYNRPELADRMAKDSYDRLVEAAKRLNGSSAPRARWDQIKGYVDRFNRARSLREKEQILGELTGYLMTFAQD